MNEEMQLAWLEISQMLGEPTREELDVFMRTWQRASQATRKALAEQPAQQEPVGYAVPTFDFDNSVIKKVHYEGTVPLYTSPLVQRTWVGLTLADREALRDRFEGWNYPSILVDATSDILKEKNT